MFLFFRPFARVARAPHSRGALPLLVLSMLALVTLMSACAAPPSLAPLAGATHELTVTARSLGPKVQNTLNLAGLKTQGDRFERLWSARVNALEALERYAQNLHTISQSADAEHERAKRYSDSLAALAGAFTPAPGAGAIIVAASSAADLLSLHAARARANTSLAHAAARAHPSIELLVESLRDDLLDIEELIRSAHAAALLDASQSDSSQLDRSFTRATDGLVTLRDALRAWIELHAAATAAISSNTEPDAREVEAAAARLRSLIQKAGGQ